MAIYVLRLEERGYGIDMAIPHGTTGSEILLTDDHIQILSHELGS